MNLLHYVDDDDEIFPSESSASVWLLERASNESWGPVKQEMKPISRIASGFAWSCFCKLADIAGLN